MLAKNKEQAMDSSSLENQIPAFMSKNPDLMAQLPGNITKSSNFNYKPHDRIQCTVLPHASIANFPNVDFMLIFEKFRLFHDVGTHF